MITIRSLNDLELVQFAPALHTATHRLITNIIATYKEAYQPEDDGYIVVVTPIDTDTSIADSLGWKWSDGLFEGVSQDPITGVWHAVILRGNQFALSILALDEGLDNGIRQRFQREV
jgi:hypothetical protein